MIVVLFDKREIIVTKAEAEKIEQAIARSEEGRLKIRDYFVKKSAIAYIKPGGYTEADMPKPLPTSRQLRSDSRSEDEQYRDARKASDIVRENLKAKGILKEDK